MVRTPARSLIALGAAFVLTGVVMPGAVASTSPTGLVSSTGVVSSTDDLSAGTGLDGLRHAMPARTAAAAAPSTLPQAQARTVDGGSDLAAVTIAGGRLVPIPSKRIIDTRTVDGMIGEGETFWYDFSDLEADVVALVLNVTATEGTAPTSFITVLDGEASASAVPTTSSLNSTLGRNVASLVTVPLNGDRSIGLYNNSGATHLIADLQGVYSTAVGAGFEPLAPTRVLDTRSGQPLGAHEERALTLTDAPADAVGVAVTVTSTETKAPTSWIGAWPEEVDGQLAPTSVLNAYAGADIPNLAIVPLGLSHTISMYNDAGTTHLIVDVVGWYVVDGGANYHSLPAQRAAASGVLGSHGTQVFSLDLNDVTVPAEAVAVAVNLTTAGATLPTYLTAYPSGTDRPLASTANARVGADVAAAAFVRMGTPGFTLYNDAGSVLALVDVQGYFSYDA